MVYLKSASGFLIFSLCGCAGPSVYDVAKPTDISLEQALTQVGHGLGQMKRTLKSEGLNAGLLADEVTVTFNVTAGAAQSNKLVLNASAPIAFPAGPGSAQINNENSASSNASRGNQITVKFKNVYSMDLNDLGKRYGSSAIAADCDPKTTICTMVKQPRVTQ